jgi:hypothetical protein
MKSLVLKLIIVVICLSFTVIDAERMRQNLTRCAEQNKKCNFPGYKIVRYGANGKFFYRAFRNTLDCNDATFQGDPIRGPKFCEVASSDYYWISCAKDGERCNFTGSRFVRYGIDNNFNYETFENGVDCNARNLGNVNSPKVKLCHYGEEFDPTKFSWKKCSDQGANNVCKFNGTQIVRYGKNENWSYIQATDEINCNDQTFGESFFGQKECQYNMVNEDSCPTELFMNGKQCVSACPANTFISLDNKLCLAKCPEGNVFLSKTNKCIETCPNGYFQKGQECIPCEDGTVTSLDGFACVTKCPIDQYLILSANRCYAHCPTFYKVLLDRNECLLNCMEGKLLTTADNAYCVSKCPAGQYQLGSDCFYDCPYGYFVNGDQCVTSCPDNTFRSSDNRACVSVCPAGQATSKSDKQCYSRCPSNLLLNGPECVTACPAETLKSFDNSECVAKCPAGQFTYKIGKACHSNCPANLFVNGAECVESCPTGTNLHADRRNCVSACPADQYLIASYSTCFYSCPFNYNTSGNTCTLISKP